MELTSTMSLLFGRDDDSRRLAEHLFTSKPSWKIKRSTTIKLPSALAVDVTEGTQLRNFPEYRCHLAYLQEQMHNWKPRRFSELFSPGYFDRLAWFTAVFGLVFGVIGVMSLVTSIVQLGLAIAAWKQPVSPPPA